MKNAHESSSPMAPIDRKPSDAARHRGPSLVIVAIVYVALFAASVVLPTMMSGGQHFPSPFGPPEVSARYFEEHAGAVRLAAFLQLGSAMPLGVLAASAASRLQFLGMKVAGIHIVLFGGMTAAVFQALSASVAWVLSQPVSPGLSDVTQPLHLLQFATGGPAFVATFGLLVAGVSVTAGLQGFVPRWLMAVGVGIAAVAELSTLVLVFPAAAFLLPVARFAGLAWMICAGALLPKGRGAGAGPRQQRAFPTEAPQT
jgi:hypothetical protein